MNRIHWPSLPWREQRSPAGRFHSFCRDLSLALGGIRNVGTQGGGHPFDIQERRVPPGAAICPLHLHLAQWELFLVRAGNGRVRGGVEAYDVAPGDVWIHPPGEAHQLSNRGGEDLHVLILTDNPPLDVFHYPDSGKWGVRPPGGFFRATAADYFDGEEDGPSAPAAELPLPAAPATPFTARRVHAPSLPWDVWRSPKGRFAGASREVSIALGARRNTPTGLGGHPFDLEWGLLHPGECPCPFHSHSAQWELFIFLSGTAAVRTANGWSEVQPGDCVLHAPGQPHQFANRGNDDVEYLLIADNPLSEHWHYPDSGKWGLRAPRMFFRAQTADYWDGEE
jgi:uncharacterized cupin superfamily protein